MGSALSLLKYQDRGVLPPLHRFFSPRPARIAHRGFMSSPVGCPPHLCPRRRHVRIGTPMAGGAVAPPPGRWAAAVV